MAADFLPAFIAEVAVWPAIQAANFRWVPVAYQLLVVNAVTVLDSAFMSFAGNNDLSGLLLAVVPALSCVLRPAGEAAQAAEQPSGAQQPVGAVAGKPGNKR